MMVHRALKMGIVCCFIRVRMRSEHLFNDHMALGEPSDNNEILILDDERGILNIQYM